MVCICFFQRNPCRDRLRCFSQGYPRSLDPGLVMLDVKRAQEEDELDACGVCSGSPTALIESDRVKPFLGSFLAPPQDIKTRLVRFAEGKATHDRLPRSTVQHTPSTNLPPLFPLSPLVGDATRFTLVDVSIPYRLHFVFVRFFVRHCFFAAVFRHTPFMT